MGMAFDRALPQAIAYGLSPEVYWYGDPWLFAAYREAARIQGEKEAWDRWAMGMYVYDAICRTSPLLQAFSKSRRAKEWVDKPYEISSRETPAAGRQEDEQADHQRMIDWMLLHGPVKN
ncbi:hypothetical protein K6V98_08345 [Collinsella sp. AGMB00827]|uniref:Uncharacterized protein n=1 Tax=Collinsella ureilytica TaxID=2869515 RepID=A0ABS7MLV7_9ACTN|nr:hypothetical protein [Collinsella urealyticum]MBY4798354.1 hypothetical protein [Collinsella urealyticum]